MRGAGAGATERPDPRAAARIAIAGAGGYVGRLLASRLAGDGHQVLALGRNPDNLPAGERISAVAVDVADPESTARALAGADSAYYLVHAMAGGAGFEARDHELAAAFGRAAREAGVRRIVYLGGLGRGDLSAHLVSRQEVGEVLAASGVPVVELRAAVILGAGSISYEMLRSLTERLPVMVCPRWITTRLQPLAECDLLDYLAGSLVAPPGVYEIGTPDVTDYGSHDAVLRRGEGAAAPAHLHRALRHAFAVGPVGRPGQPGRPANQPRPDREPGERGRGPRPGAHPHRLRHHPLAGPRSHPPRHHRRGGPGVWPGCSTAPSRSVPASMSSAAPRRSTADRAEAVRDDLAQVGGDLSWYGMAWAWALRLALGRLFGEKLETRRPDRLDPRCGGRLVGGGPGRPRPSGPGLVRLVLRRRLARLAGERCTIASGAGGRLPAQGPARPGLLVGPVAGAPGGVPGHDAEPGEPRQLDPPGPTGPVVPTAHRPGAAPAARNPNPVESILGLLIDGVRRALVPTGPAPR